MCSFTYSFTPMFSKCLQRTYYGAMLVLGIRDTVAKTDTALDENLLIYWERYALNTYI